MSYSPTIDLPLLISAPQTAFIKEVLRYGPNIESPLPRISQQDVVIAGFHIPAKVGLRLSMRYRKLLWLKESADCRVYVNHFCPSQRESVYRP